MGYGSLWSSQALMIGSTSLLSKALSAAGVGRFSSTCICGSYRVCIYSNSVAGFVAGSVGTFVGTFLTPYLLFYLALWCC